MNFRTTVIMGALLGIAHAGFASAEVIRHPIPNSTFPIAQAVQVTGNATTYYVSGQVPPVANKDADPSSREAYGDTKTQTVGVLNRIKGILEGLGLTKAFMEGYTQFFGGSQPNLPARSVVGVAALANPGFLVEIEVIAVKDAK
jgi:enamine deaminase RidA (YjgF/YER057c/UK114 family)